MHPYSSIDTTAAWRKPCFILSVRADFHMTYSKISYFNFLYSFLVVVFFLFSFFFFGFLIFVSYQRIRRKTWNDKEGEGTEGNSPKKEEETHAIVVVVSKVGYLSRGWPEGSLFNSYYIKVSGRALLHFTIDLYLIALSALNAASSTIFSLWYDSTCDWTLVSRTIGGHSTH